MTSVAIHFFDTVCACCAQAILNALEMFDNLKETGKLAPKRKPEEFGEGDGPK